MNKRGIRISRGERVQSDGMAFLLWVWDVMLTRHCERYWWMERPTCGGSYRICAAEGSLMAWEI